MTKKIRFAVVGLGHIAQVAVLPAFQNARDKCELTALISGDKDKLDELSSRYGVKHVWHYSDYETALKSKSFDAVYIALPNDLHGKYAIKAAEAGIHVLCEKPMAITVSECQSMIAAAESNSVKLMIAYRLHFEKINMEIVDRIKSGEIGEPKFFNSSFALQLTEGNIRTFKKHGGGPLFDIGIYCINAARYIFQDDPISVMACAVKNDDARFAEIEETSSIIMQFTDARLASFVCSFGSHAISRFEVVGTKGSILVDPAYEYVDNLAYDLIKGEETTSYKTAKHDQFAPELIHFADSILENREPEPSGYEGLQDIKIINAIKESIETGRSIPIEKNSKLRRPGRELIMEIPGVEKPALIKVTSASK